MLDYLSALPVSYFSIIVKREAVISRFPGGIEALGVRFGIFRQNSALLMLVSMSGGDATRITDDLERAGLRGGKDFAVGDMFQGPLLSCPGLVFEAVGDSPMPRWVVTAIPVGK